ncbi:hypothetical protein EDB19DRAFT_1907041 [Suillus lakei]|nr:hypothetical protein EDB19DRAFT_1907041 [Suillus lakei]
MAPQSRDPTHLRQYFEYLAGSILFMHALKTRSDLDVNLLAFEDDPGLAKDSFEAPGYQESWIGARISQGGSVTTMHAEGA